MELGPPYGPKDRGPLVLRAGGPAGGTPTVPLGPRTGPEDQGPPVLGPVGGPRAGCGIVCSRRGWDRRWGPAAPFGPTLCRRLRSSLSGRGQGRRALGPTAGAARRTPPVLGPVGGVRPKGRVRLNSWLIFLRITFTLKVKPI